VVIARASDGRLLPPGLVKIASVDAVESKFINELEDDSLSQVYFRDYDSLSRPTLIWRFARGSAEGMVSELT
jgi:hypothetical protein